MQSVLPKLRSCVEKTVAVDSKGRRKKHRHKCHYCEQVFLCHLKNRKYCSILCSGRANAKIRREANPGFNCKNCAKSFRPKNVRYTTFCSRECAFAYKKANAKKPEERRDYHLRCVVCGTQFYSKMPYKKYCSYKCSRDNANRIIRGRTIVWVYDCTVCGQVCASKSKAAQYCCKCRKRIEKIKGHHRKRSRYYGVEYQSVSPTDVFERDNWTCTLCGKKCKRNTSINDPLSPTLDHIIPMSKGGSHVMANLQCACRKCNSQKRDKFGYQMRLIG